MPKLPVIKPRIVNKFLLHKGFVLKRTEGSHQRFHHPDGRKATVPFHNRPLKKGTLKSILRQTELIVDDLVGFLEKK